MWAVLVLALAGTASADTAVGLRLPLEELSVWRIDEGRAWGLEVSGSAGWTDEDTPVGPAKDANRAYSAAVAGTRMRLRETGHAVRPLVFLRLGMATTYNDRGLGTDRRSVRLDATAGLGVGWQPFERVGIWLRQGFTAGYMRITTSGKTDQGNAIEAVIRTFNLDLRPAPQAIAYFTF